MALIGWEVGFVLPFVFMVRESDIHPRHAFHPTYRAIRRLVKRELHNCPEEP